MVSTHEFTSHTHEFTSRTHEVTRWGDSTTDYRLKTTVGMSDVSDTGGHPLTTYPIRRTYLMGVEGNNCEHFHVVIDLLKRVHHMCINSLLLEAYLCEETVPQLIEYCACAQAQASGQNPTLENLKSKDPLTNKYPVSDGT